MGGAPGNFGLPAWVEFTWQELPHPGRSPESFATKELWYAYVREVYRAAPRKTARVIVAEKVPAEVLAEVASSLKTTPPGKFPDKTLWLYFVWTPDGIKVRWELNISGGIAQNIIGGDSL